MEENDLDSLPPLVKSAHGHYMVHKDLVRLTLLPSYQIVALRESNRYGGRVYRANREAASGGSVPWEGGRVPGFSC